MRGAVSYSRQIADWPLANISLPAAHVICPHGMSTFDRILKKLDIWRICVYEGIGEDKTNLPNWTGYVRLQSPAEAIVFAREALRDTNHSITVELEVAGPDSNVELETDYQVTWMS